MRNLFDQYTQPENRLTHALVSTLERDRSLLLPFLKWIGAREVPHASAVKITEQQVPGEATSGTDESRGLPDACFYSDAGWALLVESKVQATSVLDQLRRHEATAKRYGFPRPSLLLLAVDTRPKAMPSGFHYRAWREVYAWFRKRAARSSWARTFTDYMEAFEAQMLANDYGIRGTITMFDGLKFDEQNPFTYREAKRLVRLLGDELQGRRDLHKIGIDPGGKRRSAITGKSSKAVWDYLSLRTAQGATNFTAYPHFTIALKDTYAEAAITIPNGVQGGFSSRLRDLGVEEFSRLVTMIEKRLRPVLRLAPSAQPFVYALQRHYPSQRSVGIMDARCEADMRTMLPGRRREAKYQPEWMRGIYDVLTHKRANIQLGLVVRFPYSDRRVRTREAIDLFAQAWIAMSSIIDIVTQSRAQ